MRLGWHIAETRDKARAEARDALRRHHNEYITATRQRPGAHPYTTPAEAVDKTAFASGAAPRSAPRTISWTGSNVPDLNPARARRASG